MLRVIAIVALLVATAHADDDINGFLAYGAGPLTGRVVDDGGKPMAGVRVHAMSKSAGDKVVMTGADGTYRIDLAGAPGESSLVFVRELGTSPARPPRPSPSARMARRSRCRRACNPR
jgi:hypothetical protein